MNEVHYMGPQKPAVEVSFKSYAKGTEGDDGYELTVTSDATLHDVDTTVQLAARARLLTRLAIVAGMEAYAPDLSSLLEQSIDLARAAKEMDAKPEDEGDQERAPKPEPGLLGT